jgi:hypothetical protein
MAPGISLAVQAAVTQQFVVARDLEASFIAQRCRNLHVRAPPTPTPTHPTRLLPPSTPPPLLPPPPPHQDASVGCFRRVAQPAALGDSLGNRFRIMLRGCRPSAAAVHARLLRCCNGQFINYYGVQRVGETACALQRCAATGAWACVDLADLLHAPPPSPAVCSV